MMTTAEIRKAYLDFFKEKGHAVIKGATLIPENDPTVLFTTAGMHPLVPYLLGETHPSGKRLVDVQRCIRTQDIDEVGDASHLTFFEMLGNWSLGDYFKEGAIEMSFEFLTKVLHIPASMLSVTCFAGDADASKDEESAAIWQKVGIPKDRIGFLPKKDNWWGPAGQTGPCGPDTEMFYWVGEGKPRGNPAENPKDWVEIWNDVFMQYNKKADGTFEPLKQKNVDTGMGLERTAMVMQGEKSVYETDCFMPIADAVRAFCESEGASTLDYDNPQLRIIIDHLKAATFIIADGIVPSNVDQGYVARRLIRRAIRAGKKLNIDLQCSHVARAVIEQYGEFYTHLKAGKNEICDSLDREGAQFRSTLEAGQKHFMKVVKNIPDGGTIEGRTAFHLYDTYGFPIELTKEMAVEIDVKVDENAFHKAFEEHQQKSRVGAEQKFKGGLADHSAETTKLHTATHLLNAALKKVLGPHVQQKGSNITQERLRFDFNHPEKMTEDEIKEVERLVNEAIKADLPVAYHLTTVEGAKKEGAIGVFDDRYASMALSTGSAEVKVYQVGDGSFSKEICGGPHVARTGMIGSFTIQKEESSSAGVRRIKAVVSGGPSEIEVAAEAT